MGAGRIPSTQTVTGFFLVFVRADSQRRRIIHFNMSSLRCFKTAERFCVVVVVVVVAVVVVVVFAEEPVPSKRSVELRDRPNYPYQVKNLINYAYR